MKCAKYFISFAVLVAPVAATASHGGREYCNYWIMGRLTPQTDGGVTSTECTCAAWSGYGERFGCNLCAPMAQPQFDGGFAAAQCLLTGALLPDTSGGCSAAGGSAALGLLAVLGVLLFCRRRK